MLPEKNFFFCRIVYCRTIHKCSIIQIKQWKEKKARIFGWRNCVKRKFNWKKIAKPAFIFGYVQKLAVLLCDTDSSGHNSNKNEKKPTILHTHTHMGLLYIVFRFIYSILEMNKRNEKLDQNQTITNKFTKIIIIKGCLLQLIWIELNDGKMKCI